ncbi:hypothetical protein GHT06_013838 [Daphnia sinensis]|uniref:Uncharacterized protein n=1 Tax=Daphnia sinensis TaxID=1820382 RepID=A0AAD5PTW7_9CRUS|nr:hypothetical protein GHT06_013838 [Daphnia sinensis]
MTTSLRQPPVPRPRQCWKQSQTTPPTLDRPSNPTDSRIQLSNDDMYRFLGKQFCPPRASTSADRKSIIHPVPAVPAPMKAPPKPPRSINSTNVGKPPVPLPRTTFLAIRTPPKLPTRPPFVKQSNIPSTVNERNLN